MVKNNRNVIECCNNTHQGVPHSDKQTICAHVHRTTVLASTVPYYYTQNMHVEWKTVTGNPQVTRKLKEFAKMCYACLHFGPQ